MTVLEHTRTTVRYEAACDYPECLEMCWTMHRKLNTPAYSTGVSLCPVPSSVEAWRSVHRTARKRADRAKRLGYEFSEIDRSLHNDEIHEINTSKQERQGRPMSDGYLKRHNHGRLPDYPCDRHRVETYGILEADVLRAYLTLYRLGDLALISMILGHGDHLRNDIMYLLFEGLVASQASRGGVFYYNRHDSGLPGLRYYKERVGFRAADVDWVLQ